MQDFSDCVEIKNGSKIPLEINNKRIVFNNVKREDIQIITLDNCKCISISGERCDYLLITEEPFEHFIELKGNKVKKAISQIENTIIHLSQDPHKEKKSYVICSGVAPSMRNDIMKLKAQFLTKYNSKLEIRTRNFETDI